MSVMSMAIFILVHLVKEKRIDTVYTNGTAENNMMVNGRKAIDKEKGYGKECHLTIYTWEIGRKTELKVMAHLLGAMVRFYKIFINNKSIL